MRFFEDESCGQCTPCRVGTEKAVAADGRRRRGTARCSTELAQVMRDASICGLGQAAPNPVTDGDQVFPGGGGQCSEQTATSGTLHRRPSVEVHPRRREVDGAPPARPSGGGATARASRFRISATRPSPAIARTAIAAPAWSRSRASACWPPPACRKPSRGHEGVTASERAQSPRSRWCSSCWSPTSRRARPRTIRTRNSGTGPNGRRRRRAASRARHQPAPDLSPSGDGGQSRCLHPMHALRARLPRSTGQRRDRHGRPRPRREDRLRHGRSDGRSTCVACGECVQACPTGALMPAAMLDEHRRASPKPDRRSTALCPYCGVGCQLTYHVKDDKILYVEGRDGPANQSGCASKAVSASINPPSRIA